MRVRCQVGRVDPVLGSRTAQKRSFPSSSNALPGRENASFHVTFMSAADQNLYEFGPVLA